MRGGDVLLSRPVAAALIVGLVALAGVLSVFRLPVSELPQVEYPTIQVTARLPGGDPATVAATVATPLERQFASIPGIERMSSSSGTEVATVTLHFSLDRDIDQAALDVQAALTRTARLLPREMTGPPTFKKVDPGDLPIVYLGLRSKTLPMAALTAYAESILGQELSSIKGVGLVNVYGAQKYAIRVDADPVRLSQGGIGLDKLADLLESAHAPTPAGAIFGSAKTTAVEMDDRLPNAAAFRELVVNPRSNGALRLGDVAVVRDGVQQDKLGAWINGEQGILLAVDKQFGGNVVEVVDAIRGRIPAIKEQLPPGVQLDVFYDRTTSIRASIADVGHTLLLAVLLAVITIGLFLGSIRAAAIPAASLPISLACAVIVLYLWGGSLNIFTMLALTLSVGFIVDDAIVVLEDAAKRVENGIPPSLAAKESVSALAPTVLSMTLSLVIVFIPFLFMESIVGRLLREFAVVTMAAVLASGMFSLFVTPLLCSLLLRKRLTLGRAPFLERVKIRYLAVLERCLRKPIGSVVGLAAVSVLVCFSLVTLGKGFLPSNDTGLISVYAVAEEDISFDRMSIKMETAARTIRHDPAVATVETFFGVGGGASTLNVGRMMVVLKPHRERDSALNVAERLREPANKVPGLTVYLQSMPTLRLGIPSKAQYQYVLRSSDAEQLAVAAPKVEAAIHRVQGVRDVSLELYPKTPRMKLVVDRDAAAVLGVSSASVRKAANAAFGPRQVGTVHSDADQFAVLLQVDPRYQEDPALLSQIPVSSASGTLVPLSVITKQSFSTGPAEVTHTGQLPSVTLSFDVEASTSLGSVLDSIRSEVAALKLPPSVHGSFQGSAEAFEKAVTDVALLLLFTLVLVYVLLGILYESFLLPLVVITSLPAALLGATLTLWMVDMQLDLYAAVGLVMLVGIAKKNAIILVGAATAHRQGGLSAVDAIRAACSERFRPVMMTSLTAIAGAAPIAIGLGVDADSRRSLGLVVVGGLVLGQAMTLFATPALYSVVESIRERARRSWMSSHAGAIYKISAR